MRRCFIHLGTHKTGTTSLQYLLHKRRRRLADLGFLYPQQGRPRIARHGHHNLAWELSGDRRFDPAAGCVSDMLREVERSGLDVILSSEDFECSVHHTPQFDGFMERMRRADFRVIWVLYVRNQIDYAKSLYGSILENGAGIPFGSYLDEIVETGKLSWREWIFPFDYASFVARLRPSDGADVVVRSFDATVNGSLIADFLAILGVDTQSLRAPRDLHLNRRRDIGRSARSFYRNCVGRRPSWLQRHALKSLIPRGEIDMRLQSKLRLIDRFDAPNRRLCAEFGLVEFAAMRPNRAFATPEADTYLDDIFKLELVTDVEHMLRRQPVSGKSIGG